jgi:uncharacterized protein
MSRENVELAARFYEAATSKAELLAALPEVIEQFCDPEIEWVEDPQRADARTYHGHDGAEEALREWLKSFREYSFTIQQIVDCGDDVLVIGREEGRGIASGAAVGATNHELLTIRDGKIVRFREFYDEVAAFRAAGVSKEAR